MEIGREKLKKIDEQIKAEGKKKHFIKYNISEPDKGLYENKKFKDCIQMVLKSSERCCICKWFIPVGMQVVTKCYECSKPICVFCVLESTCKCLQVRCMDHRVYCSGVCNGKFCKDGERLTKTCTGFRCGNKMCSSCYEDHPLNMCKTCDSALKRVPWNEKQLMKNE